MSTADRLATLIRLRIERNRFAGDDLSRLAGARFRPLQLPQGGGAVVGGNYQRRQWSLGELLAFHDRQFVQNAYLVLLKRDADVEGLTARLQMLHSGTMTRLEVLFRLRYGPEGKQHGTRVEGLLRAFLIERLCAVPVLGALPRYLRALLYLPRMQRDLEQLRALVAMQKNDSDDRDRAIVDFQNTHFTRILGRLEK